MLLVMPMAWLEAGEGRRNACVLASNREETRIRAALSAACLAVMIRCRGLEVGHAGFDLA